MVNVAEILLVRPSTGDPALVALAESISRRWGFGLVDEPDTASSSPVLFLDAQGLELREGSARPGHGLRVDFSRLHPRSAAKRRLTSRDQPLAKAIGRTTRTVLDATAGLGNDAALLASLGFQITAAERSPVIAALLENGLARAQADPVLDAALGGRLSLVHADARDVLAQASASAGPGFDAAYIDPMFPEKKKKSALSKKDIRMVRQVVGDDDDAAELLVIARQACPRVVVKRADDSPPIPGAGKPTMSLGGTTVRFDVYLRGPAPTDTRPIA